MAEARYLLTPAHFDYGVVCPECAGPKCPQSKRCAECYYAARRRGEYPLPPRALRVAKPRPPRTGSKSNPQPASHPWRRQNALLFRQHVAA